MAALKNTGSKYKMVKDVLKEADVKSRRGASKERRLMLGNACVNSHYSLLG